MSKKTTEEEMKDVEQVTEEDLNTPNLNRKEGIYCCFS